MARYNQFSLHSHHDGSWKVGPSGRILNPGMYEGEPAYLPYFHAQAMEGCAQEDAEGNWYFDIDKHDREMYPELNEVRRLYILQDDSGFVYHLTDRDHIQRVL